MFQKNVTEMKTQTKLTKAEEVVVMLQEGKESSLTRNAIHEEEKAIISTLS